MKINKKTIKTIKKIFSLYNLAILACIVIIIVSIYVIFKPNNKEKSADKNVTQNVKIEVVKSNTKEITEENARNLAKKQFKKLGEKNIKEEELSVEKIQRQGEEYYYISSKENTLEIQIKSGKITRVNSVAVQE